MLIPKLERFSEAYSTCRKSVRPWMHTCNHCWNPCSRWEIRCTECRNEYQRRFDKIWRLKEVSIFFNIFQHVSSDFEISFGFSDFTKLQYTRDWHFVLCLEVWSRLERLDQSQAIQMDQESFTASTVFAKKCKECHIMSPCKWNIMEPHVLQMFHTVSMLVQWHLCHLCHLCQVHVRLDQMDRAQASLLEKATSCMLRHLLKTELQCWSMLKYVENSWMRCNSAFLVVPHDPAVIVRLSRCLLVWSYVCVSTWHFA